MKKIQYLFLMIVIPAVVSAQDSGIKFEDNRSWPAILAKAKAENKDIFMDCYTTWCGPCKMMAASVFPQKEVGDYFNAHFINVSVQMDRTANDPERIKVGYGEADSITAKYGINAYPTYLIFSQNGEALDRFVGAFDAKEFLDRAADALIPEKQYFTLINHYQDHSGDSVFLRNALSLALNSYDQTNAANIAEDYFGSLRDPFSVDNIRLLYGANVSNTGKVFQFFLRNATKIDEILARKDPAIENRLCFLIKDQITSLLDKKDTIFNYIEVLHHFQDAYPVLASVLPDWVTSYFERSIKRSISTFLDQDIAPEPNWNALAYKMRIRYHGYDCDRLIDEMKPGYYENKKMWPQCEKSALDFLVRYGDKLDADVINKMVWDYLFMYSSRPAVLKIALKWSKRSVDMSPGNCGHIDTYANVLYKTGDRQNALQWEKKAVDQCGSDPEIRSDFEKMKNRQKTWGQ